MQKTKSIIVLVLITLGLGLQAQERGGGEKSKAVYKAPSGKAYPAHWGAPPRLQTRDFRVLPGGYGRGSGTLARWIQQNLDKDAKKENSGDKPKVTKKAYPKHWGAPPNLQTSDYRPLPGGYGFGSSTVAGWIQQNLDNDANKDKPGNKPWPIKPVAGRKAYPKHWGAPPRLQTKDLRPLPGGFGHGSNTLAKWIQKNLDNDTKNGVPVPAPAPAVAVDPVAPRPVDPPVFDPNAKARELAEKQAKMDTTKVKEGIKAWEAAKAKSKGNYSYKIGFQSWVGFGHETTIVVKNNKVTERHYRTFNRRRPVAPLRPGGVAPAQPKTISWVETGKAIGTNKRGAPAKTLDELYKISLQTAQKQLKQFERRYIRSDKQGLLVSCYIMDRRIADDAPRNGLVVSSIQLGGGVEGAAAVAPPAAVGGGDCALCRTEAHQLHLGQAENGGTITVKQGSTLNVKLKGNPTTGFTWNNNTLDHGLKLLGEISHKAGGRAPGAPGMSTATFQAMKLGKTQIVLEYRRVFEDKPPVNTVKINIVVTEDGRAAARPAANKNQARIAELEKEIARMKDFARRARFTPEGLQKHNAKLAALENELAALKDGKGKGNAKVHKAPNGKAFLAHWGAPPLRQTRDRRPLPGGYGQGSGTLARWIQGNLDNDAKGGKPGAGAVKPRPPIVIRPGVRPLPGRPQINPGIPVRPGARRFPAHWGDPPRIQTRDLRPLPGGYGMGSGTLARWIQQNLDKDAAGRKPGGVANPNQAQIARLEARVKQIKSFMVRARMTKKSREGFLAKIENLERQIAALKKQSSSKPSGKRPAISAAFAGKHPSGTYAPGELLVGVQKGTEKTDSEKALKGAIPGVVIVRTMINDTILHVRLPETTNVEQAMAKLKGIDLVRYAELNGIASIQPVPRPGIGIQPLPRPGIGVRPGPRIPRDGKVRPFKIEPRKIQPRKLVPRER